MSKVVVKILENAELEPRPDLVGNWLDERHYHTLVESDMDLYLPPKCSVDVSDDNKIDENHLDERNIVFKFRKGYFSQEMVESAYEGLRDAAQETQNRGNAAGPAPTNNTDEGRRHVSQYEWAIIGYFKKNAQKLVDEVDGIDAIKKQYQDREKELDGKRTQCWLSERIKEEKFDFEQWIEETRKLEPHEQAEEAEWVESTFIGKTTYANSVNSGIAGWYDRYPRIPYGRATNYTEKNPEKFSKSYPYLKKLSDAFQDMLPWRYNNQKRAADSIDPKFLVPDTPFSTITVNRNFRTAAHYDPANMENGFANICVFSNNGKYSGAYLVFPEIGYAVNVRPGDLLFVNNQAGLHGNTELILEDPTAERISIIAYFHEGMLELGSWDYEQYRKTYVEKCMQDKEHPFYKKRFNGVFPGMWADKEEKGSDYKNARGWYDYMLEHPNGKEWIAKHHPWLDQAFSEDSGLGGFFD